MTRKPLHRLIGHVALVMLATSGLLASAHPAGAATGQRAGSVPDAAFLQPEDNGGHTGWRPDADLVPHLRPPLPCGPARYVSQRAVSAQGAMAYDLPTADFHTVVVEHIAGYRGSGAVRYVGELRRALAGAGCTDRAGEWTVLAAGAPVPGSLVIRLRQQVEDYGGNPKVQDTYLAVAPAGRAVVVLADLGWESASGQQAMVTDLIGPAARRAALARL